MANFRTHIAIGTMATGFLATITMATSVVTQNEVVSLALAGALGSVLPDVDLQRSRSSRAIFFTLALFLSFCVLFAYGWKYSILEMWLIWLAVFLGVRYFGQALFHNFAVHRGIFHSILAGVFFAFATAAIFFHILGTNATFSWLAGFFVFFGYIIHLLLDEVYSVDFDNTRIKRSFGSALKLYEYRSTGASIAMLMATVLIFYFTPSFDKFVQVASSKDIWALLWQKLLPEDSLFSLHEHLQRLADYINGNNLESSTTEEQITSESISALPTNKNQE